MPVAAASSRRVLENTPHGRLESRRYVMSSQQYQPLLHRLAVLTACAALVLPITAGAVVTTLDAGMAFPDWPSSDGWFMLTYPWVGDLMQGAVKKFVEHGHRLAGALIGLVSIGLAAVFWWKEPRRWVRWCAAAVLLAVIAQGLLGGGRVLLDQRVLALLHGLLASLVLSLMAALAVFTSRGWWAAERNGDDASSRRPKKFSERLLVPLAVAAPVVILAQFLLGGMLRHLGRAVIEHVVFAIAAAAVAIAAAIVSHRGGSAWTARASRWMLAVLVVQIVLGGAAWLHKFGFAPLGYVAVHGSAPHVVFRTAHAVVGMLLVMTAVVHAVRVFRSAWVRPVECAGFSPFSGGEKRTTEIEVKKAATGRRTSGVLGAGGAA